MSGWIIVGMMTIAYVQTSRVFTCKCRPIMYGCQHEVVHLGVDCQRLFYGRGHVAVCYCQCKVRYLRHGRLTLRHDSIGICLRRDALCMHRGRSAETIVKMKPNVMICLVMLICSAFRRMKERIR